jgi:hypothetical protein
MGACTIWVAPRSITVAPSIGGTASASTVTVAWPGGDHNGSP